MPLTIKITRHEVQLEPPVEVFQATVERPDGVWEESFGSRELLEAFIRGVKAGSLEYVDYPEIPKKPIG